MDFSKYPKPDWAVRQIVRASGLVEDVCKCGIGHPNKAWLQEKFPDGNDKGFGIHGCCGHCAEKKNGQS